MSIITRTNAIFIIMFFIAKATITTIVVVAIRLSSENKINKTVSNIAFPPKVRKALKTDVNAYR